MKLLSVKLSSCGVEGGGRVRFQREGDMCGTSFQKVVSPGSGWFWYDVK